MSYRQRYFEGQVTTPAIVEGAVTEEKIADNAVTSEKIKDETIKSVDIGPGQVRTEDIADGAVTLAKLGGDVSVIPLMDGSVTNTKIATGAVSSDKLAGSAVIADKIASGAVTSLKIADGSITGAKIASNTITGAKIAANAVGSSEIAPNAVGYSEIASQSLEPRSIKTLSGLPPTPGQVPAYDESQGNLWWFKWVTPGAAARPLTPPITTDEIGDGQVTPAKLSFNPAQIRVGFYDGDGNPSQVISVPGLNPQGVIIYPQASGLDGPYIRVGGDSWTQTISWAALGLVYGGDLILLGADGFTVAGGTNTNGVRYSYIALG